MENWHDDGVSQSDEGTVTYELRWGLGVCASECETGGQSGEGGS